MFDVLVAILRGLGLAGAALLLGAGLGHARSAAQVRALLRAHGLVRPVIVPLVARLLGPIEIALGALVLLGGSVGVAVDRPPGTPFGVAVGVAAMASAVLYVLFAAYLLRLLRIRPGSPCGCRQRQRAGERLLRRASRAARRGVRSARSDLEPAARSGDCRDGPARRGRPLGRRPDRARPIRLGLTTRAPRRAARERTRRATVRAPAARRRRTADPTPPSPAAGSPRS